ncbi:MAG: hypothetical protein O3A25_00645 [Acidobacteria bacterium]|nr:hypothetical protein [Acidobacteriota bacterium]
MHRRAGLSQLFHHPLDASSGQICRRVASHHDDDWALRIVAVEPVDGLPNGLKHIGVRATRREIVSEPLLHGGAVSRRLDQRPRPRRKQHDGDFAAFGQVINKLRQPVTDVDQVGGDPRRFFDKQDEP